MRTIADLPKTDILLNEYRDPYQNDPLETNAHFHTPYSFSAFGSIHEIFEKAESENISVLGINDFITTFGYVEFNDLAFRYHKFPLFCIEFMGLLKDEQRKGIRINDPSNPGRIYFCGKGLAYPERFGEKSRILLQQVFDESHRQMEAMTRKLNGHLQKINAPFNIEFEQIKAEYSKGMVRERHIAKALRIKIRDHFKKKDEIPDFLKQLYCGGQTNVNPDNPVELDNELRSRLLKKGGIAFVEEDEKAFLSFDQIRNIIIDAGGIPCYPVLLDDITGNYTDFESDFDQLFKELAKRRVYTVELIPGRNDIEHLKRFVHYFSERGFIITLGTEHNTPEMLPLKVCSRGGTPIDKSLRATNYFSACILAAHQYLIIKGKQGYITEEGFPRVEKQEDFIALGNAVIRNFIKH